MFTTVGLAAERPHIIVITLDTTRADALSCYGQPPDIMRELPPVTPNLDAVAAQGLRFEAAYAHAPTTLSSHASLFTGHDPHGHGVPHNGQPLPGHVPTLAERLQGHGYETIAVVGSSALSASMGLNRGFAVYDDTLSLRVATQVEDRADAVVDRVMNAIGQRDRDRPLFLWAHFFDAHAPYDAPVGFRDRFVDIRYKGRFLGAPLQPRDLLVDLAVGTVDAADVDYIASRYLAEVSFVDAQIGRLMTSLEADGLLDRAVVVVTADHGETLSEHPRWAWSHGFDVPNEVIRVPLIIRGYGASLGGPGTVERQVGLASVGPTLERLAGLPPTLGGTVDLWDLIRPGPVFDEDGWPDRPTRTVFSEATRGRGRGPTEGWNNLRLPRSVRAGGALGYRGIIGQDPFIVREGSLELLPVLRALVRSWDANAPVHVSSAIPSETRQALEALGYSHPALDSGG